MRWSVLVVILLVGCTQPVEQPVVESQDQATVAETGAAGEDEAEEPQGNETDGAGPQDPKEPEDPEDPEEPEDPEDPEEPEPSADNQTAPADNGTDEPEEPVGPQPPDWGDPDSKGLRPGINMVHDGAGCTTSFIFHVDWTTYYMATAAHCVSGADGCSDTPELPSQPARLRLATGGTVEAHVAYHSWSTMARVGETDADACDGNDFALLQIPDHALAQLHPASLHFEAPTGLATSATSTIWGYGASSLKLGLEPAHPKQGVHLGMTESGWSHWVYLATPGIPGDSGGHIMTDDGQALGIASRIILAPYTGANLYTDIAMSLQYMERHEGWAPELVTWDGFRPSLV